MSSESKTEHPPRKGGITLPQVLGISASVALGSVILAPAFARARTGQSLNTEPTQIHQVAYAVLLYANDWDDCFPFSLQDDWKVTWADSMMPYIRSGDPWVSPYDLVQGPNPHYSFLSNVGGRTISIVSNSFYYAPGQPDSQSCGCANPCVNAGMFAAIAAPDSCGGGRSWLEPTYKYINEIKHPEATIMLAFRYNTAAIGAGGFGNNTHYFGAGLYCVNCYGHWDWADPVEVPDGRLPVVDGRITVYPKGRNGAVSSPLRSRLANFAFADGHVATLEPGSTDPDPVNQPANNMWDADR